MNRLFTLLFIALFFASCGETATEVESTEAINEEETITERVPSVLYNVDPAESEIEWLGRKMMGTSSHHGTVEVTSGQIMVAENTIAGGKFSIDLRNIKNIDVAEEKRGDLEGHLKGEDFFYVEKYPMATFDIIKVQKVTDVEGATHNLTGNLTMRGVTRGITIPANINIGADKLTATTPTFTIDRYEWGVTYGSGQLENIAKDKVIDDDIELKINLVANR